MRPLCYLALALLCSACTKEAAPDFSARLDPIAEQYVRLALALGEHDSDYVDAYFGPAEWRDVAREEALPLPEITAAAEALVARLQAVDAANAEQLLRLRHNFLLTHLQSLAAVSRVRDGLELSFDEESRLIYGFVAPSYPVEHYAKALEQLDAMLPGDGPTHERYREYRQQYRIPDDKVEAIVRAGIDACREQTRQHIALPKGENFTLEFVRGEPWGAYNWYQGNAQSLIQVNLDKPRYLGTSIRLGCHEGYPGHHTFSSLLDELYLQQKGWVEFSVYPLFSPQAVIFEGSGDLALAIAFPGDARYEFLREVIVPMTGNDAADLEALRKMQGLRHEMRYAGIEAARKYLDGDWSKDETI
ncbi:MAG: hypothetical protein OEM85_14430, partial [Gammaproteobacteria bacterium]|nr:hypothetical protein [Gammaproteobacteria bacterium]